MVSPILTHYEFTVSEVEWKEILGIEENQPVDWSKLGITLGEVYRFRSFWGYGVAFICDVYSAVEAMIGSCADDVDSLERAWRLYNSKCESRPPAVMDPRWLLYVFNP